jgi:DNA-binding transcriptional regulator YiaG
MPNIAAVLKTEIARVARKELRAELRPLQEAVSRYRSQIAQMRKSIAALERDLKRQGGRANARKAEAAAEDGGSASLRFSPKGLATHRQRLGLSAAKFAELLGVSALSVYKWESGKTRPRAAQIARIAEVRSLGKREAMARLESGGKKSSP